MKGSIGRMTSIDYFNTCLVAFVDYCRSLWWILEVSKNRPKEQNYFSSRYCDKVFGFSRTKCHNFLCLRSQNYSSTSKTNNKTCCRSTFTWIITLGCISICCEFLQVNGKKFRKIVWKRRRFVGEIARIQVTMKL